MPPWHSVIALGELLLQPFLKERFCGGFCAKEPRLRLEARGGSGLRPFCSFVPNGWSPPRTNRLAFPLDFIDLAAHPAFILMVRSKPEQDSHQSTLHDPPSADC